MGVTTLILFTILLVHYTTNGVLTNCNEVQKIVRRLALENNETRVCSCLRSGTYSTIEGVALDCANPSMPHLDQLLRELNGTKLGSLTIRDSTADSLPLNMFENVNTRKLKIERTQLSMVENNSLGTNGAILSSISLRMNKVKTIENGMFSGNKGLRKIDLSSNKITTIEKDAFNDCQLVIELVLNDNELSEIEDGAFSKLTSLRTLSMVNNKLHTINKGTFRGLSNLEVLQLQDNNIENIDWAAFAGMKKLKVLNLGSNHISIVQLRGLLSLQRLILNNNSIDTLRNVKIRDMPSLTILTFDRNRISSISDVDLTGLSRSTRLESLGFASNNISYIAPRAFQPVQNIKHLTLQNNQLDDLTSKNSDGTAFLTPLKSLVSIHLSHNGLSIIRANELPKSLVHLSADHNKIEKVEPRAFDGIKLKRLFLNKNKLQFLYHNAFASFSPATIEAIDVSSNDWQCVCKDPKEWLPRWLEEAEDSDVSEGPLGCLAIPNCGKTPSQMKNNGEIEVKSAGWITVTAIILSILIVLIMCTIAGLYCMDLRNQNPLTRGSRTNSDLHKLIENDPLNFMNSDSLLVLPPMKKSASGDKKRVRFEDC